MDMYQTDLPPVWNSTNEMAVLGMAHALPGEPIATNELLAHVDSQFGLDIARKGRIYAEKLNIRQRHLSRNLIDRHEKPRPGHRNPELAAQAVSEALENAGINLADVGYLIGHTATPAMPIPSNISLVADILGFTGPHVEMRQACTGFANALVFASGLIASGCNSPIVIVGSETGSAFFDPERLAFDAGQLVNLVQMGDGAAAIVLSGKMADYGNGSKAMGTLGQVYYGQIGTGREPGFSLPHGGSDCTHAPAGVLEFSHAFGDVRANGPELFVSGLQAASHQGLNPFEMDYLLPHQANGLMDSLMAEHLGVDADKVVVNADRVGNTGSAAIWLALSGMLPHMQSGETLLALGAEATKYMFGGFLYQHGQ